MSSAQTLDKGNVGARAAKQKTARLKWRLTDLLPLALIFSLLIPYRIQVGPLLLSPNRMFLLVVLIPCLITILSGRFGRVRIFDILMFVHALWMSMAFLVAHGLTGGIEPAGVHFVEVMGSYLVARCYIRSAEDFRRIVQTLFLSVVIMLPFLLAEAFTGRHFLNRLLALFGPAIVPHEMDSRLGLDRAFGVFDHPILLGVYCASIFSLTWYVLGFGSRRIAALLRTGIVAAGTASSLSAGPLMAMVVQAQFIAWDFLTRKIRRRWMVLAGLAAIMYVLVDLVSNRTPFHVIVSYLTFNTGSAYNRILIWHFGSAEVLRHPIFGIGLGDWERPYWMSNSIDNFWLVLAVQGGAPAFLLFAGAVLTLCTAIGRRRLTDPRLIAYRRGWMITIVGLVMAGATVHYWKTMFCLLVFLIGSGAWLLETLERRTIKSAAKRPKSLARKTIQFG